jgi:hypothetical protein
MYIPDLINAGFELTSSLFVADHIRHLLKDKKVAGFSVVSVVFFTLWGFFNLYYYREIAQVMSFYGSIALVATNSVYVGLLVKYRKTTN